MNQGWTERGRDLSDIHEGQAVELSSSSSWRGCGRGLRSLFGCRGGSEGEEEKMSKSTVLLGRPTFRRATLVATLASMAPAGGGAATAGFAELGDLNRDVCGEACLCTRCGA